MTNPICTLIHLPTRKQIPCPLPDDFPFRFSVALGNFDGVHVAHRRLLSTAKQAAQRRSSTGAPTLAAAWCFRVPSIDFLYTGTPSHLTTTEEKLQLFSECGLEYAFLADFTTMRHLSPEDFVKNILRSYCSVDAVTCGFNFHYGAGGVGNAQTLRAAFGEFCDVLPCHFIDHTGRLYDVPTDSGDLRIVSSSNIRTKVTCGDCRGAAWMLGRPYDISGEIVHGKHLGHTLGFPTINLPIPPRKLVPKHGVYASLTLVDNKQLPGVSNIGIRPTVDHLPSCVNCETHLLDFSGDLYGKRAKVYLLKYLREERAFDGLEPLIAAIRHDITQTQLAFSENEICRLISLIKSNEKE